MGWSFTLRRAGVDRFVAKPFTPVRLVQEVAKYVPFPGKGAPPERPTS
jgi:hypothetical protein